MKIVIEIDEERYTDIQRLTSVQLDDCRFKTTELIIANGIPLKSVLEDIKAEIKAHSEMHYMDGDIIADELLEIIDKYMRGTENE